jgi:hypothetical protein
MSISKSVERRQRIMKQKENEEKQKPEVKLPPCKKCVKEKQKEFDSIVRKVDTDFKNAVSLLLIKRNNEVDEIRKKGFIINAQGHCAEHK